MIIDKGGSIETCSAPQISHHVDNFIFNNATISPGHVYSTLFIAKKQAWFVDDMETNRSLVFTNSLFTSALYNY